MQKGAFFMRLYRKIKVIFSVRFPEHFGVERKHFYMQCLHDFWQTIPLYFSQTISHDFPQSISHDFWQTLHLPISHRWCISTSLRRHKKLLPPFPFWTFCSGQSFINFVNQNTDLLNIPICWTWISKSQTNLRKWGIGDDAVGDIMHFFGAFFLTKNVA